MKQQEKSKQKKRPLKGPGRYVFIALGILTLTVGAIGVVLPFLPSTPFFLITVVCFTKGSHRLHDWFLSTALYKKHLESFVQKRAMTKRAKVSVICSVTILMVFCFVMMRHVPVGQIVLVVLWLSHVLYFVFRVKVAAHNNSAQDGGEHASAETGVVPPCEST